MKPTLHGAAKAGARVWCSRPLCDPETTTRWLCVSQGYGGYSGRETPGYIPNPEVKPSSADGTAPGTVWESRTPPDNLCPTEEATPPGWLFLFRGSSMTRLGG